MSLIGDALKKAHLEAVRQDGTSHRLAHTPGVAQYRRDPHTGRKTWTTALVVSNVILVLIVATAIVWGLTRDESSRLDDRAPVVSTEGASATTAPISEQPADETPEPVNVPSQKDVSSQRAAASDEPVRQPERAPVVERAAPVVVEPPTASTPPTSPAVTEQTSSAASTEVSRPPTPRTRGGYVHGQTYMRSIPVPGGSDLTLNGMSIAGGKGVALINSRMVREGDTVGPFTVGVIADRRVALHYDDITIYLKLP